MRDHDDLVCVHRCTDAFDLGLVKSLLTSANVPFVVLNEAVASSMGLPLSYGRIQFMVSRRDADDARAVLDQAGTGSCADEGYDSGHS